MRVIALLAMLLVLALLTGLKNEVLALLGRSADVSGRTEIWAAAWRIIRQHMVCGNGYGSAPMGGLVPYLVVRFKIAHTQNGYLDLALSGGVMGSALLIETLSAFLICWGVSAFSEVTFRPNNPMGALGIAALVVLSSLPAATRVRRLPVGLSPQILVVRDGPA